MHRKTSVHTPSSTPSCLRGGGKAFSPTVSACSRFRAYCIRLPVSCGPSVWRVARLPSGIMGENSKVQGVYPGRARMGLCSQSADEWSTVARRRRYWCRDADMPAFKSSISFWSLMTWNDFKWIRTQKSSSCKLKAFLFAEKNCQRRCKCVQG